MQNGIKKLNSDELNVAFSDCIDSLSETFLEEKEKYLIEMTDHMNSLYEIVCEKYRRLKDEQSNNNGATWQGPRDKAH